MPALKNARHERFVQELFKGKTEFAAYKAAGYKAQRSNASRLIARDSIRKRLAELQGRSAEKAAVTVDYVRGMYEEAANIAREQKQAAALNGSATGIGKLYGMIVDKSSVKSEPAMVPDYSDVTAKERANFERILAKIRWVPAVQALEGASGAHPEERGAAEG